MSQPHECYARATTLLEFCLVALLTSALASCDVNVVVGDSPSPTETGGAGGDPSTDETGGTGGAAPTILWSSDHETGDLTQWEFLDSVAPPELVWGGGTVDTLPGAGRNATYGVQFTIDTIVDSPSHGARLYRSIEQEPAYYGAWFRLEEHHEVSDWWAILVFQGRADVSSLEGVTYLWDVRLVSDPRQNLPGQGLRLQFFEPATQLSHDTEVSHHVPVGEWFHLETYLDFSPPQATHARVYLNDTLVFDVRSLVSDRPPHVLWGVGNGGAGLVPTLSTLFVDDATVATGRLGTAGRD